MKGNIDKEYLLEARRSIGARLRSIREDRKMTAQELADLMCVDRATINKIELGKWAISIDYLTRFSLVLDFKVELLTPA